MYIKLEEAKIVYENSTVIVKTDNLSATLLENGDLNFKEDATTEQKEALQNWLETWGYNVGFSGLIGFKRRYEKGMSKKNSRKVIRKYWFKGVDAAISCGSPKYNYVSHN
jgi:hypothetical protein